jgi:hypothetical protein
MTSVVQRSLGDVMRRRARPADARHELLLRVVTDNTMLARRGSRG